MCLFADPASQLVCAGPDEALEEISRALAHFGEPALRYAARRHVRIIPLEAAQRYSDASAALRRLSVDVDAWPVPPAGLFVVEERTVYLRSPSPMTVAHEFGHALDCALGGGVYRSSYDLEVRRSFANAKEFVTPYAATGLDEYFAESLRAYVECNDRASCWPRATKQRLRRLDPAFYAFVERLFAHEFSGGA